jgi:hypothetical protein
MLLAQIPVHQCGQLTIKSSQMPLLSILQITFLPLQLSRVSLNEGKQPPFLLFLTQSLMLPLRVSGCELGMTKTFLFTLTMDGASGAAMFATDKSLRILASCSTIFLDGIFRSAPIPYYQLVTIHGMYQDAVVPLCFCLMTGKSLAQYRHVLHELCSKIRALTRRRWLPDTAICDFELALILALETELPAIRVRGCYFHFSKSLWRKFSSLGLISEYRRHNVNGRRLRKFVQKTKALGFLPPAVICNAFNNYCASASVLRLCCTFPRLRRYIRYIARVYVGRTASFRPPMWSVYDRAMNVRTNNSIEG